MSERIQCLIFVKSGVGPTPEGFTLINPWMREIASDRVLNMLSATAPYVNHEQFDPPQNAKFDMIEVWQDFDTFKWLGESERPRVYVDVYDLDLVRRLFPPGSNVQFVTNFRISKQCLSHQFALGKDNLKIIEKLLESGVDIKWRRPEGGATLAHFAVERDSKPLMTLLSQLNVEAGREVDALSHAAVEKKSVKSSQKGFQCLILLKSEGESGIYVGSEGSSLEGYTLVNPHVQKQPPVSMISSSTPIVTHEQVSPSPNSKYDLIEIWQDHTGISDRNVAAEQKKMYLYVDVYNLDIVRCLFFAVPNIQFVTKFRVNEKSTTYQKFTALEEGNLTVIRKLLESGADIRWRRPEEGTTLAHFAAAKGSAHLLALLSQCGVNLDAGPNKDPTPLHNAVKKKNIKTVKTLLGSGADINGRAADGSTALHIAAKVGELEMVKLLVEKGAHLEAKNAKGWTPLFLAADVGNVEVVSLLSERGADLESRIDSPDKGATPLHAAIKKKRWTVAKWLVENGAKLDAECTEGRNALYFAVATEDFRFIEYLLERDLDLTSPGNRKAFYLAFRNNSFLLRKMMQLGFSVEASDAAEPDVLFGAIHKNLFELVQKLLESGVDVHQSHSFLNLKMTPIHVACRYADERMVQLLLDHGADLGAMRGTGRLNTTMADAVESGNAKTVKLLLDHNMSVRDRPDFLLSATCSRSHELMKLLLDNGATVNCRGSYTHHREKTSMFFAAGHGDEKSVDILVEYGAVFNFEYVFINVKPCFWGRVTPEFLEGYLAYSFTTNLDATAAVHLQKLLTECDVEPNHYDGEYYVSLKKKCARVVAQHIVKMESAGMAVAGSARSIISARFFGAFSLDELRREFEGELALMKARKIAHTRITFFHVLTETSNRVARYMQNEGIRNELCNLDFKHEYPHFARILHRHVQRSSWRSKLLSQGIKKLCLLNCRFRTLPFELKEHIAGFLYNQDLLMLQKCEHTSES